MIECAPPILESIRVAMAVSFQKRELRNLITLSLPILATQLAQIGMGTVDTLMSGHVSTEDLAAVAIGTSIWTPVMLLMGGIIMASSPLASALHSARRQQDLYQLLAAALWSAVILGIGACALLFAASFVLEHVIDDPRTSFVAANYTRAAALGMPAMSIFLAYRYYAEALGQPGRVTRIMLLGLLLNIPINAIFIYGWLGMPALGGIGCGVGTTIVSLVIAFIIARDTRKHRLAPNFPLWREALKPVRSHVVDIFKIGVPIGVAIFFEVSLFVVIALFLTPLGPTVVAGHQVALNLSSLTFMLPLSMGMALTVRVSHWRGQHKPTQAAAAAWLGVKANFAASIFNALLMVLLARYIARLYSPDPEVVTLATTLLYFAAIFQLSDAIQVAAAGALRAYHDTFKVMLITAFSYWMVGLGSGYWFAYHQGLGAKGFWIGLIIGLSTAAVLLSWRLRYISLRRN